MKTHHGIYRFLIVIIGFVFGLVYGVRTVGRDRLPQGNALFCANHSSWSDPFFIAVALGGKRPVHFMSKSELFKNGLLRWLLNLVGAFPVDRSKNDISSIKTALKYLKNGCSVGIFPQGTRVSEGEEVDAKRGAVRLAEMSGVPIVPIYVPVKKCLFSVNRVIIGEPLFVKQDGYKLTKEESDRMSQELLTRISELAPEV